MVAQIIKKQIKNLEYREKNIIRILFSVFALLLVSYGFLVNATIMNAIERQNIEKEILSLSSDINQKEFGYLEAKNSITIDLALANGFIQVKNQKFVSVEPVSSSLSLSINENQ